MQKTVPYLPLPHWVQRHPRRPRQVRVAQSQRRTPDLFSQKPCQCKWGLKIFKWQELIHSSWGWASNGFRSFFGLGIIVGLLQKVPTLWHGTFCSNTFVRRTFFLIALEFTAFLLYNICSNDIVALMHFVLEHFVVLMPFSHNAFCSNLFGSNTFVQMTFLQCLFS